MPAVDQLRPTGAPLEREVRVGQGGSHSDRDARFATPNSQDGTHGKSMSHDPSGCPCGNSEIDDGEVGFELELL
jgi:hypothetical protein